MAAEALLQQVADEIPGGSETSNKKRRVLPSVLEDDRFKAMFQDPSFAVDEAAEEYKFHHPNAGECPCFGMVGGRGEGGGVGAPPKCW